MKFDTPAGQNPIDQLKVVGKATDRIDGKFKTTGTAPYAYERHDVVANQARAALVAKYEQYRQSPPTGAVYRVATDEVRWWRWSD